jgi:hypothetical protein
MSLLLPSLDIQTCCSCKTDQGLVKDIAWAYTLSSDLQDVALVDPALEKLVLPHCNVALLNDGMRSLVVWNVVVECMHKFEHSMASKALLSCDVRDVGQSFSTGYNNYQ